MTLRSVLSETFAWRLARGLKRIAMPPRFKVPVNQRNGVITWTNPPPSCETQTKLELRLKLENRSAIAWPSGGAAPVTVRAQWLARDGSAFDLPATVWPLSAPLYPGEPDGLLARLEAPDLVGDFQLQLEFLQNGEGFAESNTPLMVVGSRSTDIDYHSVYRTADLDANHWWVVGAYHSKEQYERSSRERLDMLIRCGLKPDFRVLDIGCGTGQMASALMPYLTENGAYAGTDIGAEAIDFCLKNFRKRNFDFRQGGMTDVPFDANGTFDMAIFFSVFTHTYPDEAALLMAEARRLLKPTGSIIADVITSPLVERGLGHRGEMVLNKDYFLKLARMLGYEAEVIGRWPWNRHAERFMFQLRQSR